MVETNFVLINILAIVILIYPNSIHTSDDILGESVETSIEYKGQAPELERNNRADDCSNKSYASCSTYMANLTKEKIINEVRQLILSRLNLTHEPSIKPNDRYNFRFLEDISKNIDANDNNEITPNKFVRKTKYDMLTSQSKLVKTIHEAKGFIFSLIIFFLL